MQQPAPPDGELQPNDEIHARDGTFKVLYYLGGGTYGRVYRARWSANSASGAGPPLPTDVVLKQLRRRAESGESEAIFAARVEHEASMTLHLIPTRLRADAGVDAATICRSAIACDLLQFASDADERYLVFPWMTEAETLRRFVDRHLHVAETSARRALPSATLLWRA